jgi:hypothetical protein
MRRHCEEPDRRRAGILQIVGELLDPRREPVVPDAHQHSACRGQRSARLAVAGSGQHERVGGLA